MDGIEHKCNYLTPLHFKGLSIFVVICGLIDHCSATCVHVNPQL